MLTRRTRARPNERQLARTFRRSCRAGRGPVRTAIAFVVLSAALRVAAGSEPAQPAVSPIRIERCEVLSRWLLRDPLHGLSENVASGLWIRFVNVSPRTATLVQINVRYQGTSDTIADRGVFTSGVPIDRTYQMFAGQQAGSDASCSVTSAAFTDGTVWSIKQQPG